MPQTNKLINNLTGGEISPRMYGRADLPIYPKSLAKCQNFIVMIQGGARFRNGTTLVHQTRQNKLAWLIPFQFSDQQSYLIEATDLTFRFYSNGGIIFKGAAVIERILRSYPGIFQSTAHGFTVGQKIQIDGVVGVSGVNGTFLINTVPNANQFTIKTLSGTPVDTRAAGAYKSGGTATPVNVITGATNANPGVFTSAGHGLANGQEIQISGINGMSQINGQFFTVANVTTNTFTLVDLQGNPIDTTTYGAYTSGGAFQVVYEVTTPYVEADLSTLQFTQNANTMYIAHQNYEPRKLVRTSASVFAINTYTRTNDPFNATNKYPRAVSFVNGSRLAFADTKTNPETFWASAAPSTTNTDFDNFTTSPSPVATDSVVFTLTPLSGKTDAIQWISSSNQFGIVGCFGSLRTLYGGTQDQAISPLGVTSKPINDYGCAQVRPITTGESVFYVQRGSRILRTIDYDYTSNGYVTDDKTIIAEHLTVSGIAQIVYQNAIPDCVWCVRGDGKLIGLTYKKRESIAGWHQHALGGQSINDEGLIAPFGQVISIGIMPRAVNTDQLWLVVERLIGVNTIRTVEYITDVPEYQNLDDFFTSVDTQADDLRRYRNAMFETQKYANHLDMAAFYDGSQNGSVTMTPSDETGSITVTASDTFFTADMVGRQLWKQYDLNGNGGGRCTIDSVTDSTHAQCTVVSNFDNANMWGIGNWLITAGTISGLNYAEGALVNVIADGGAHPDCIVTDGAITLQQQSSVVFVGFKYTGILESLNLDPGGQTGPAESKPRSIAKIAFRFLNTISAKYGTSYYDLEKLNLRDPHQPLGRPTVPFNDVIIVNNFDGWANHWNPQKRVIILQDNPVPCTLLSMDIFTATVEANE